MIADGKFISVDYENDKLTVSKDGSFYMAGGMHTISSSKLKQLIEFIRGVPCESCKNRK